MICLKRWRTEVSAVCIGMSAVACDLAVPSLPDVSGIPVVATSLISITAEPAGANCVAGGSRVDTGLDNGDGGGTASDGILEPGEIDSTAYICNGSAGTSGASGTKGSDGTQGSAGTPGVDGQVGAQGADGVPGADGATGVEGATGHNSLIAVVSATATDCASGGELIEAGVDNGAQGGTADDGILQQGEIQATAKVCNGAGGRDGATGSTGATGQDGATGAAGATGQDGATGATGATGQDGATGATGATGQDGATGATGAAGGDGTNGQNGATGATGTAGQDGNDGNDGYNSLIRITPNTYYCAQGFVIDAGLDNGDNGGVARDSVLEDGEVDATTRICSAPQGGTMAFFKGDSNAQTSTFESVDLASNVITSYTSSSNDQQAFAHDGTFGYDYLGDNDDASVFYNGARYDLSDAFGMRTSDIGADGSHVVFVSDAASGGDYNDIYYGDLISGDVVSVTNAQGENGYGSPSIDGGWLIYTDSATSSLYSYNVQSQAVTLLGSYSGIDPKVASGSAVYVSADGDLTLFDLAAGASQVVAKAASSSFADIDVDAQSVVYRLGDGSVHLYDIAAGSDTVVSPVNSYADYAQLAGGYVVYIVGGAQLVSYSMVSGQTTVVADQQSGISYGMRP